MSTREIVQRVCMYISEQDRWEGQPLHMVILERLRREGATGTTALRGIAGFGPGHRTRVTSIADMNENLPILLEWIDRIERVSQTLPLLDDLLSNALVTIEEVAIYRASLRSTGPFASNYSIGDFMQSKLHTLAATATLDEVFTILMKHDQKTIPIIDEYKRIVGLITEQDIAQRTTLRLPLRLLPMLTRDEQSTLLAPLTQQPVTDVMSTELRSVYSGAAIPQALAMLIEWNYEQLPVLDREGALVGLFSRTDILRAALQQDTSSVESSVRNADPPTPVRLIMQTTVPQIAISQSLAAALYHLLTAPDHYLVVVDAADRVQGSISCEAVIGILNGPERTSFLLALAQEMPIDMAELPGTDRSLDVVLNRDIATVAPDISIVDATRYLLAQKLERAPVVDGEGQIMGMLSRGGLLRALVQANQ